MQGASKHQELVKKATKSAEWVVGGTTTVNRAVLCKLTQLAGTEKVHLCMQLSCSYPNSYASFWINMMSAPALPYPEKWDLRNVGGDHRYQTICNYNAAWKNGETPLLSSREIHLWVTNCAFPVPHDLWLAIVKSPLNCKITGTEEPKNTSSSWDVAS